MNHGLLENLARRIRTVYLSDLRMPRYRRKLIRQIEDVRAVDYELAEWRDAIVYLTGIRGAEVRDMEEAKEFLLERLEE